MSDDPLTDVIREATADWWRTPSLAGSSSTHAATAVRTHLAALIDAEESKWDQNVSISADQHRGAVQALDRLRAVLEEGTR